MEQVCEWVTRFSSVTNALSVYLHSFLGNLPSRSSQRPRWWPENSKTAKDIIIVVLEKFESIAMLDIRPHLGDSTSVYFTAACEAIITLNEKGIRRDQFKQLLISHTSYRPEKIDMGKYMEVLTKLDSG
jgi:hypothetical protein